MHMKKDGKKEKKRVKILQEPLVTRKRATIQPSAFDTPSQRWGERVVLAKAARV